MREFLCIYFIHFIEFTCPSLLQIFPIFHIQQYQRIALNFPLLFNHNCVSPTEKKKILIKIEKKKSNCPSCVYSFSCCFINRRTVWLYRSRKNFLLPKKRQEKTNKYIKVCHKNSAKKRPLLKLCSLSLFFFFCSYFIFPSFLHKLKKNFLKKIRQTNCKHSMFKLSED